MTTQIKLSIDGKTYHVTLKDNSLTEQLVAICPFTVDCNRSGEHEYYARLPKRLQAKNVESTTTGHASGVYFFEDWNAISLVFCNCNTAPYKIHHIGDFVEDISVLLDKSGRTIRIICELE